MLIWIDIKFKKQWTERSIVENNYFFMFQITLEIHLFYRNIIYFSMGFTFPPPKPVVEVSAITLPAQKLLSLNCLTSNDWFITNKLLLICYLIIWQKISVSVAGCIVLYLTVSDCIHYVYLNLSSPRCDVLISRAITPGSYWTDRR